LSGGLAERVKVGVDIGSAAIKVVQMKKKGDGYSLLKLASKDIVPGSSDEQVAATLGELLKSLCLKSPVVRLVISDPAIYLRHIRIPAMTEQELVKSIKWLAEKYIPFPVDGAVVDFQVLRETASRDDQQMDIVIVAVPKKIIEKYLGICQAAGMNPVRIDIPAFTVARTLLSTYSLPPEEMAALVHIGAQNLSVVITKGGRLQFVRQAAWGGGHLTEALMKGMQVDFVEAEKIKKEFSLFPTTVADVARQDVVARLLEPTLAEFVSQVNRCFAYCERELMVEKIHKVYLCGGTAALGGLAQYLSQALGLKVEQVNVYQDFLTQPPSKKDVPAGNSIGQFTGAIGVVLE